MLDGSSNHLPGSFQERASFPHKDRKLCLTRALSVASYTGCLLAFKARNAPLALIHFAKLYLIACGVNIFLFAI